MESDNIKKLLDKYFESQTTLSEEKQLREYFSAPNVAPHLQQYQDMFKYYSASAKEDFQPQLNLKSPLSSLKWISIAASVVILLGAGIFAFNHFTTQTAFAEELGTYDDPQQAFEQTQKALAMLSRQVNVGIDGMQYVQQYENTKDQIFITE